MREGPGIDCPFGHMRYLGERLPSPAGVRAPANRDPLAWRPRARGLIGAGPRLLQERRPCREPRSHLRGSRLRRRPAIPRNPSVGRFIFAKPYPRRPKLWVRPPVSSLVLARERRLPAAKRPEQTSAAAPRTTRHPASARSARSETQGRDADAFIPLAELCWIATPSHAPRCHPGACHRDPAIREAGASCTMDPGHKARMTKLHGAPRGVCDHAMRPTCPRSAPAAASHRRRRTERS
jgi:hypothetical protein